MTYYLTVARFDIKPACSAPDGPGSGSSTPTPVDVPIDFIGDDDDDDDGGEEDDDSDSSDDGRIVVVDIRWGKQAGYWLRGQDALGIFLAELEGRYGEAVAYRIEQICRVARDDEHFEKLTEKAGKQLDIVQGIEGWAGFISVPASGDEEV